MFRRLTRRSATRGMTLIELAIAIFVLTIGSIAALRAADQSARVVGGEMPRLLARIAARNRAEELKMQAPNTSGLKPQVTLGGQVFTLSTVSETTAAGLAQTTITARAESGEGAQLVVYLPKISPR
ncbi:type IV pilus modification PilV family protein [Primorskyibacter sp. 2E233]|uniref:type IV pilus modification PilV family protein n=1 Tax=Primorskyibacter sp. 2E233 TaxID=3413431 RepID=UPI003BF0F690